ncbi:hypothetical protein RHMOL_Rhmol11G0055400 [Rhododendron molle]|uniref:Uncharacterized protein n=1 Tax=Rhododendron molle TaxID=49168 RepID=A0ACC0LP56_RHOML|nr:hypothetical protein RHMOL_Rhmol11G0055400 [Rhododendron molle]
MAIYRRGFPEYAQFREIEQIELTSTIRALQLLPFTFVLFCVVLTLGIHGGSIGTTASPPSGTGFPSWPSHSRRSQRNTNAVCSKLSTIDGGSRRSNGTLAIIFFCFHFLVSDDAFRRVI